LHFGNQLGSRIKERLYDVDVDIGSLGDITELHILAPPLLNELAGDEHDISSGKGIFVLHGLYPTIANRRERNASKQFFRTIYVR
jgi:hypothetical protein